MANHDIALQHAANMFGGDVGLLNVSLGEELKVVNKLVMNTGGFLRSRQIVALIVHQWMKDNSDRVPYGE